MIYLIWKQLREKTTHVNIKEGIVNNWNAAINYTHTHGQQIESSKMKRILMETQYFYFIMNKWKTKNKKIHKFLLCETNIRDEK